jgi:Kef-type K+ transport system membrane component KefB
MGEIVHRLGQPQVLGEILAGILLGPTVFGRLAPKTAAVLFPAQGGIAFFFDGLITLAITLFLLVAGMGVDLTSIWRQGKTATAVSLAGICFPFAMGFAAAWAFPSLWGIASNEDPIIFSLFLATALSISALPVIAKILMDLGLYRSDFGMLVVVAAVFDDLIGWVIFAIVLGMAGAGGGTGAQAVRVLWMTLAFTVLTLTAGRWVIHRVLARVQAYSNLPGALMAFALVSALLGGALAEWIGTHACFGSFLAGVALGDSSHLREHTRTLFDRFVSLFFAPLFFATIGLRTDFLVHFDGLLFVSIVVIATIGKVIGCGLAARLTGMTTREAWAVGFAMNARGAMQIVLGLVALQAGVINERLYVALVGMALFTTLLSGPAISTLLRRKVPHRLTDYLSTRTFIRYLASEERSEAIREMAERVGKVTGLRPEEISVPVLRRERAMATGIGNGIAVPHARVDKLRKPIVSVALSEFGVDFDAPDGERAQVIFLILLPETDEGTLLLDVHADIARKFSSQEMRRSVFQTRNFHEFLGLLKHDGA